MTRAVTGWMMAVLLATPVAVTPVAAQFRTQPEETAQAVPRTLMVEFRKLLDAKAIVAVDVRSPEAYQTGHIPGAVSIPLDLVPTSVEQLRRLGKPIVFYCSWANEHTSAGAALQLRKAGLKNVSALLGGYKLWTANGYPVARGDRP